MNSTSFQNSRGMRTRTRSRRSAARLRRLLTFAAVIAVSTVAGYLIYRHQVRQNTQQVLHDARLARDRADWNHAADNFRRYLRRSPSDKIVLSEYVDLLLAHVDNIPAFRRDAVQPLLRLISLDDLNNHTVDRISQLTNLFLSLGQFDRATQTAKQWAALDPQSLDAVLAQANGESRGHRPQEAVDCLRDGIRRFPREPRLYPPLIQVLSESGLDQDAEAAVNEAIRNCPSSSLVQLTAFGFFQTHGNIELAESHLQNALELAPDSADTLARAAMFYLETDRISDAKKMLDRAVARAPSDRLVLSARAALAVRQNDPTQMRDAADALIASGKPTELDRIAQAAELYIRAGDTNHADDLIHKLADVSNPGPKLNLWLNTLRGALAATQGHPYAAIPLLENALTEDATDIWAAELLAPCLLRIGAIDEAASAFRKVISLHPKDVAARIRLASIEADRGRCEAATNALEKISGTDDRIKTLTEVIELTCDLRRLELAPHSIALDLEHSQLSCGVPSRFPPYQGGTKGGYGHATRDEFAPTDTRDRVIKLAKSATLDDTTLPMLVSLLIRTRELDPAISMARDWNAPPSAKLPVMLRIGRAMLATRSFEEVAQWSTDMVHVDPARPEGYFLRVENCFHSKRADDALAEIQRALVCDEDRGMLWARAGELLIQSDQQEKGLDLLRRAAALRPNDVNIRQTLIRLSSNFDDARRLCEEIQRIEGNSGVEWRFQLASSIIHFQSTGPEITRAEDLLESCVATRPGWTDALLLLGFVRERLGRDAQAAESYHAAFAQDPGLSRLPVALQYIRVLRNLGRNADADAVLDQLASALPDSPEVLRLDLERHVHDQDSYWLL